MNPVCILGGGPAGSAAALAALRAGSEVRLIERSRFPRHKVCGEFLSPGIEPALARLGLWSDFQALQPAIIRRMSIQVGRTAKTSALPEPAFGLSRYALDAWLWENALAAGAKPVESGEPTIVTTGRASSSTRGGRLFGFKAHFAGPTDDAVELYFAGRAYVGVNCVENGLTNVCGLAPEEDLRAINFQMDDLVQRIPALQARLHPLRRCWDWIFTGPLEFGQKFTASTSAYVAGDALSFVDPFTGSGLLCAVLTGSMAGDSAAKGVPVPGYLERCARSIRKPFRCSSLLRRLAKTEAAETLLHLAPASLLFRWTRPA